MPRRFRCVVPLAISLGLLLPGAAAQAQLARTFVSSVNGNDANDCGRATPCRTFQGAHDKTFANGEITVLDPGGYGAVTITKAISIINDGVGEAGALVSGNAVGITITAGANDAVSLRGLTVKGIGFGGGRGILFTSGRSLSIENCVIRSLDGGGTADGIQFFPNASSRLFVANTLIADNIGIGAHVLPVGAITVTAVFNQVQVYSSGSFGVSIFDNSSAAIRVVVADSVIANNGDVGIRALANSGSINAMVVRTISANNGTGLSAGGTGQATMRVSQSTLTGNTVSWTSTGSALTSFGDNLIEGNADTNPAPPVIARK